MERNAKASGTDSRGLVCSIMLSVCAYITEISCVDLQTDTDCNSETSKRVQGQAKHDNEINNLHVNAENWHLL